MNSALPHILTAAVALVLIGGATMDALSSRISNSLVLLGLILALAAGLAEGGFVAFGAAAGAAAVAFVIGFGGFALGAIGGGDAKFMMVGAAAVGLPGFVPYLIAAGAFGGLLALILILWQRRGLEATVMTVDLAKNTATFGRKGHRGRLGDEGRLTVPYGVAIAAGALLVRFTPFTEWLLG